MFRSSVVPLWAILATLAFPVALAAQSYESYQPHYLSSIPAAADQLRALSPHLAPVQPQGNSLTLTNNYALARMDVSREGVTLYFSRSPAQRIQYYWLWGKTSEPPAYDPYTGDIVTSIVFANIDMFKVIDFPKPGPNYQASWCAYPDLLTPGANAILCAPSQPEVQELIDALATLLIASGGDLIPDDGFGPVDAVGPPYLHKHPKETGCVLEAVEAGGPPAQAGILTGDILHAVNGKPYVFGQKMLDNAIKEITSQKPGGGIVHLDLFRNHKPLSVDVTYTRPQQDVEQLRKQGEEMSEKRAAPSPAASGAPPSGLKLGVQVRPVNDADVATFGLAKAKGIVVLGVDKSGLADVMGFQPNDVILEIDGAEIGDLDSFAQILHKGSATKFHVWRKGQALDLVAPQSF